MAARLHYLTVQDMLWINLQVTGKVNRFSYAKLEEATYYQYAYGDSKLVANQAAQFLSGFLKVAPLDAGNEATALIGCLAFLSLNGMEIELRDSHAMAWIQGVSDRTIAPLEAIKSIAKPTLDHHGATDIKTTVKGLLGVYAKSLKGLV